MSVSVGELYATLELKTGPFNSGLRKSSDAVYGFAKVAAGIAVAGLGALSAASVGAAHSALDYYRASAKVATITGLNISQSSRLLAVFQRYGIDGAQASQIFSMLEKNVGKLTLSLTTSTLVGKTQGATTQQITRATERLRLAQMRLSEMQAKGTHSASSLYAAQIAVANAESALTALQGRHASAGLLVNKTVSAAAKFEKQYGFALRDSAGHVKDANALILQAADYFTNKLIPPSKRAALEAALFGRNWQALIPILSLGSKGIKDAGDAAAKLGLVLSPQNAKDLAAYSKAGRDLGEAMAALKLKVGILVIPILTQLTELVTSRLIPAIRNAVDRVHAWVEAHKPLFDGLRSLVGLISDWVGAVQGSWMPSVTGIITSIGKWIAANRPLFDQLRAFSSSVISTGVKSLAEGFKKLGSTAPLVAALAGALLLVIGAIRANPVVAALTAIVVGVGLFRKAWDSNFGGIQDIAYRVLHAIQGALTELATPIRTIALDVLPTLGGAFDWLRTTILPPLQSILNTIATVWLPALLEAFKGVGRWLHDNWPAISELIGHLADVVAGTFAVISPVLVKLGETILPAIGTAASAAMAVINTTFTLIGDVWKWLGDRANDVGLKWDALQGTVKALSPILDALVLVITTSLALAFAGWMTQLVKTALLMSADLTIAVTTFVAGPLLALTGAVWGAAAAFTGLDLAAAPWIALALAIGGIIVFLGSKLGSLQDWINTLGTVWGNVWHDIVGAVRDAAGLIAGIVGAIIKAVQDAIGWLNQLINKKTVLAGPGGGIYGRGFYLPPPPGSPPPSGGGTAPGTTPGGGTKPLPIFAAGTPNFVGGWAMVGEQGPEAVRLPSGTRIFPADETAGMMTGGGVHIGRIEISGVGNDVSPGTARRFAQTILDEVAVGIQEQASRFGSRPRVTTG